MKLKEKPLDWWKGRKFSYWCKADINDETKINYTLNWFSIGDGWTVRQFTSDDEVDPMIMYQIRNGYVHEIKKENGEWYAEIDYPFPYEHPENDKAVLKTRKVIPV